MKKLLLVVMAVLVLVTAAAAAPQSNQKPTENQMSAIDPRLSNAKSVCIEECSRDFDMHIQYCWEAVAKGEKEADKCERLKRRLDAICPKFCP